MAAAIDEPLVYPDSPTDPDDTPYPCKGCGEILEEGKAFELAGNRWHIDCFRCNTCDTLLDSDANLLLLGDGSLICNNCTYSCSSCGNKIEDLAILTGDQAFCANCFKCRNCKKKIENLRYARTSQGIFCMDCHEALMAKRRKKTSRNTTSRSKLSVNNSVQLDKSLPAIPPPEARQTAYIPDEPFYPSGYSSATTEVPSISRTVSELRELDSRPGLSDQPQSRDNLTLPSTTFRDKKRQSFMSQNSDLSGGGDEFLIPLAFDPTPPMQSPTMSGQITPRMADDKSREYFAKSGQSPAQQYSSQSRGASPHIAYQEKGRQSSKDLVDQMLYRKEDDTSRSGSLTTSPYVPSQSTSLHTENNPSQFQTTRGEASEKFKLQAAPNTKRLVQSAGNVQPGSSITRADALADLPQFNRLSLDAPDFKDAQEEAYSTPRVSEDGGPAARDIQPPSHPTTNMLANLPKRGDSLGTTKTTTPQTIPRKELNANASIPAAFTDAFSTTPKASSVAVEGNKSISAPIESPQTKNLFEASLQGPGTLGASRTAGDAYTDPRIAPQPPASGRRNGSVTTLESVGPKSPALPRWSAGGEFSMEEDFSRILSGDDSHGHTESFLRRSLNSVRHGHGRSYSDKTGKLSKVLGPRSPGAAASLGQEISSPTTASPENRDEIAWLKNELKVQRQKLVDRDRRIAELEVQLESAGNIKQVNSELREKRSTIVVLDTRKEIVVRELEVLAGHIAVLKTTNKSDHVDLGTLNGAIMRDFAEQLEKLKDSFAPQIEESVQKRNDLIDEIANLASMKEKSFAEFEQLSLKNAQLAELNNQLVHQIQELYKANSGSANESKSSINGLGIYSHHKDKSNISVDSRELRNLTSEASITDSATTLQAGEAEPVAVLQGPQVVNIRKGQPKKFDWRKGQKVAKGVTKGLKGAFTSTQQGNGRDLQFAETGAYGGTTAGQEYSALPKSGQEPVKQGFGIFGPDKKVPGKSNGLYGSQNNASTPALAGDSAITLYGTDLEPRTEYEKTTVPYIIRRCIEEVENRGMDVEGIYRKSGGSSQVQQVKDGFERASMDYDISDPDLDIHAVTSGFKQYFRKLPTPLVTYEVYDKLLATTNVLEEDARIEAMQLAVSSLPKAHYDVLEFLVHHLARVALQAEQNLMTSLNVAVVFAPTIMRPESVAREMSDTKMKNDAVKWMVDHADQVFPS